MSVQPTLPSLTAGHDDMPTTQVVTSIDLPAGTDLGGFRIVSVLGRGGMGVVYEAEDTLLLRRVAIKQLASPCDSAVRRLMREAQAVARLSHPHVVAIHHLGRGPDGHFLVLELMRGSLLDRLRHCGPLPWREAVRAAADACRGLAAAHASGLVHRDVKPGNLMIDACGSVKVADFGLVAGGDFHVTPLCRPTGTPYFMSPEQCRGDRVDGRADLYALGATLYFLFTGRPPFEADTALQVMFAHCNNPRPDLRVLRPDLPASCTMIVQRAMAIDPAARFQDAGEMLAALLELLEQSESVMSQNDNNAESKPTHPPARWKLASLLASALLVAATAIIALSRI